MSQALKATCDSVMFFLCPVLPLWFSPEARLGISDVLVLSGISGLSLDSAFSCLFGLFFGGWVSFFYLVTCLVFLLMAHSGDFSPIKNSSVFFLLREVF